MERYENKYYLTIIPRAGMGSWAIDSEAMRARGTIVLVKSCQVVKNIETNQPYLAKRDSATIVLVFKADAFRY